MNTHESEPIAMKSKRRWPRATLDGFLIGVLIVGGIVFFSPPFKRFAEMNIWPAPLAMASVAVAALLMLLALVSNLVFHRRFRFGLRAVLWLAIFAALPGAWLAMLSRAQAAEREAVERAMAADRDDQPSFEAFTASHAFPYSAPLDRKNRITENYRRLQLGQNKSEVAVILGAPDCSEPMRSKGPRDEYLGTAWTYYLDKPDPNLVNTRDDTAVEVYFDRRGKVHWVVSNVAGLAEIGGPGRS